MEEKAEYILIRARRKTVSMKIDDNCNVVVRAPLKMSKKDIDSFVERHKEWINKHKLQISERNACLSELSQKEISELTASAQNYIPIRVKYFSALMGVEPTGIKITGARKRFGSCSGKNGLCFSYMLMLYPPELIDYVVVHELAHIRHHDHSAAFYGFMQRFMPDHREREKKLKSWNIANGRRLSE